MNDIFWLLLLFQVKHLIADYYLQLPYMYENKGKPRGWFKPLFDHAVVHATGTMIIVGPYLIVTDYKYSFTVMVILAFFDLVTHFIIDRWKATRKGGPNTPEFWQYLGIDQMLHHVVGILIIMVLTKLI
jgi:hypothetical protein